jgi:hypothetical protein
MLSDFKHTDKYRPTPRQFLAFPCDAFRSAVFSVKDLQLGILSKRNGALPSHSITTHFNVRPS